MLWTYVENIVATFRRLPYDIPKIESLGLPDIVIKLTQAKKGLILITGGTGSGKSTTMAGKQQFVFPVLVSSRF